MTLHIEVFKADGDPEGEWVRFGPSKFNNEDPGTPPPQEQTLLVNVRLTAALLQRQQDLGPLLAPAYVPPANPH